MITLSFNMWSKTDEIEIKQLERIKSKNLSGFSERLMTSHY